MAEWAGTTLGKEYYNLILNKQEAVYNEPAEPTAGKDGTISTGKWKKYELQLRLQFEKVERYNTNKGKLFRLLMVQCQTALKNKLECLPDYQTWEQNDDVVALLKKMKELVYNTEKTQYEPWTQQAVLRTLLTMQQGKKESLSAFYRRWDAQREVTETILGKLIPHKYKGESVDNVQEKQRNKLLACIFLGCVSRDTYKDTIDDLNNDFLLGNENYPEDPTAMLNFLSNRRGVSGGQSKAVDDIQDGIQPVQFSQSGTKKKGKVSRGPPGQCWICDEKGHKAWECPLKMKKEEGKPKVGFSGFQSTAARIETQHPFQGDEEYKGSRTSWD